MSPTEGSNAVTGPRIAASTGDTPSEWQQRIAGEWVSNPSLFDAEGNHVGFENVARASAFENGHTRVATVRGAQHRGRDPYQPNGDAQVRRYFTEIGMDVLAIEGLKCPTAASIAHRTSCARRSCAWTRRGPRPSAGLHQPVQGAAGGRGRVLAAQAGHLHQRRGLVVRAARERIGDKLYSRGRLLEEF